MVSVPSIMCISTVFPLQQAAAQLSSSDLAPTPASPSTSTTPPSTSTSPQGTSNFLTYTNSTYGISIQYPSDWILTPLSQPLGTNNTFFGIIEFVPPISQDPNADTYAVVWIDNITRRVTPTLDGYTYNEINAFRANANVTDLKVVKAGTNVTI